MEDNTQLQQLIQAFQGYRELLTPLQENMRGLSDAFDSLKSDVAKLNEVFSGGLNSRFDAMSATLEKQAVKSTEMVQTIERFTRESGKYFGGMSSVLTTLEKAEQKLGAVEELENTVKGQIKKLDAMIEDKRINYNVKDLQKTLDAYNANVKKMSDFINKDVAESLAQNAKEIERIKRENETVSQKLEDEQATLDQLLEIFRASNEMLKSVVDKQDVNEAYIFDILDKWAVSRKVKIKKQD